MNTESYKKLEARVQELEDMFARLKRTYDDLLYNLDDDNVNSLTANKITAGTINTSRVTVASKDKNLVITGDNISISDGVYDRLVMGGNSENEFTFVLSNKSGQPTLQLDDNGNIKLSGNITWDISGSPVQSQYSVNGSTNWHDDYASGDAFMRMSFDGGQTWSNATKIVGADGRDGYDGADGSDASVTDVNVFNALTSNGSQQGIFNAFYADSNKLFINAQYIKAGTLDGELVKVENVLWLKNNAGNDVVSIFHDETDPNNPLCLISTQEVNGISTPILLYADGDKVYIGNTITSDNEVATIGYVNNTAGYARFG